MTRLSQLLGPALAGAATGLRSTAGIGTLIEKRAPGIPRSLRQPRARQVARAGVAAELVVDKLPSTPSRLDPPGLVARVTLAGASGAALAQGAGQPQLPSVLVASSAALLSARIGHDVRVAAAQRFPPLLVALFGDGIALSLAAAASREPG